MQSKGVKVLLGSLRILESVMIQLHHACQIREKSSEAVKETSLN